MRQLRLGIADIRAKSKRRVHDAGQGLAALVGHVMKIHLLLEPAAGRAEKSIILFFFLRLGIARSDLQRGDSQSRPRIDHRKSEVNMIEHHVRRRLVAFVLDLIVNVQLVLAHEGKNGTRQREIYAEDGTLHHLPLHPNDIVIAIPSCFHIHFLGRNVADTAVKPQRLAFVLARDAEIR